MKSQIRYLDFDIINVFIYSFFVLWPTEININNKIIVTNNDLLTIAVWFNFIGFSP